MKKVKIHMSARISYGIFVGKNTEVSDYYDISYYDNNVIIYTLCSRSKQDLLDILYNRFDKDLVGCVAKEDLRATKIAIEKFLKQEREDEKS